MEHSARTGLGRVFPAGLMLLWLLPACFIHHPVTGVVPGQSETEDVTAILLAGSVFAFSGGSEALPVSGASLWMRGDRLETDFRGTAIWYDASGNNRFLAGNGINRVENAVANRPAALCNGTSMVLRSITGSELIQTDQGTTYLVLRQAGGKADNIAYQYYASSGNDNFRARLSSADALTFEFGENDATGTISTAQPAGWDDNFHVVELYRSGTNGEIVSDGAVLTATTFSSTVNVSDVGIFYICGGHVSSTRFLGEIAEMIVYPTALSGADRSAVRCHLSNKYSLAATGC
ncbi:MAG: hypothetical protein RIF32_17910 [Leptospirales bacterium]|jgi:hypothetical protein